MSAGKGKAVASLVLGIIACIFCWIWGVFQIIGVVAGIVALVLAVSAMNTAKAEGTKASGMAVAGLVLGLIGLVLGLILFFACGLPVLQTCSMYGSALNAISDMATLY